MTIWTNQPHIRFAPIATLSAGLVALREMGREIARRRVMRARLRSLPEALLNDAGLTRADIEEVRAPDASQSATARICAAQRLRICNW